ncbi:MAG: T9SS type A sorting domain-containing protein [Alphaproteobacteria bacterium]|nr:T9SS type A sorting domain-containing protein [Alphaproteobacteria bacterium]
MPVNPATAAAALVTSSAAARSKTKLAKNFDQFLTLLTTQLKYQDPLKPMDSTQFTNQLVSFSQVEQSINTNKNLENLISQTKTAAMSNAVGYLGTDVTIKTDQAGLRKGTAKWQYNLQSNSDKTTLTVQDANGQVLYKGLGNNKAGVHDFIWNAPENTPAGVYTLTISAKTANGSDVRTAIFSKGKVEDIETRNGKINLSVNGILTPVENIQTVQPSSLSQKSPV